MKYCEKRISKILKSLSSFHCCFSVQETVEFDSVSEKSDFDSLEKTLSHDDRFIMLRAGKFGKEKYFIPRRILLQKLVAINIRLAKEKKFRLKKPDIADLLGLRKDVFGEGKVPAGIINFGKCYGLLCSAPKGGGYAFPIARILSFLPRHNVKNVLDDILENFPKSVLNFSPEKMEKIIKKQLLQIGKNECFVVMARSGLLKKGRLTFQQVGDRLKITRHQAAAIEKNMYRKLLVINNEEMFQLEKSDLLGGLLRYVMKAGGSLLVKRGSGYYNMIKYICAVLKIPSPNFKGYFIIGASKREFNGFLSSLKRSLKEEINARVIGKKIASRMKYLPADDVEALSEKAALDNRKNLPMSRRVYMSLGSIGKPAHYSKAADAYNRLFPEDPAAAVTIHNALMRNETDFVRVGIKGVYALTEWGYKKPDRSLREIVAEIVRGKFGETGKPVPFNIIETEMGRYRSVVNPASLSIASRYNPGLERLPDNTFILREPGEEENEIREDELDRILEEFEKEMG